MATVSAKEELKELYDKDFPLWVEINLNLLKEKKYDQVDWENLLEEIEDMGKSELDKCIQYLTVILEHLYKWDHLRDIVDKTAGTDRGGSKWIKSINNARRELKAIYKRYPSLKHKTPTEIDTAWIYAKVRIENWLDDNDYDPDRFNIPEQCPYTYEEAMNRDVRRESDIYGF